MITNRFPYFFIVILVAVSMACTFGIPNFSNVDIGSMQTFTLSESPQNTDQVQNVTIAMTIGQFALSGGADSLLEGEVRYNVADWEPQITSGEDSLTVSQGDFEMTSLGFSSDRVVNEWDLKLGNLPMNLTLSASAYDANLDLGGLPLKRLAVQDGAGDTQVHFDSLNPEEMELLAYQTGASNIRFTGLANANFAEMAFEGGAGEYTFDFSGALQRDATVSIDVGLSDVRILVPEGVSARLELEKTLADVAIDGEWTRDGGSYVNPGNGSQLTIMIEMGAGTLQLANE